MPSTTVNTTMARKATSSPHHTSPSNFDLDQHNGLVVVVDQASGNRGDTGMVMTRTNLVDTM